MKITELLKEDGIGDYFSDIPLANVFGQDITPKNFSSATGIDPRTVYDYGKKAVDIASTKLFDLPGGLGEYTVGDALIDVPLIAGDILTLGSMTPALLAKFSTKVAANIGAKELEKIAARKGAQVASKDAAKVAEKDAAGVAEKNAARAAEKEAELAAAGRKAADEKAIKGGARSTISHEIGSEIKKHIKLDPLGLTGKSSGGSSGATNDKKKRRYNVGDIIPVSYKGKKVGAPVTNVLSTGYEVSLDKFPGEKPGSTMNVPEPSEA